MYSLYNLQFPILHAKLMIMGLWLTLYFSIEVTFKFSLARQGTIDNDSIISFFIPMDSVFLLYSIYMVKGVSNFFATKSLFKITLRNSFLLKLQVRDEYRLGIYFVYFGDFIQALILSSATINFCYTSVENIHTLSGCFKYSVFF